MAMQYLLDTNGFLTGVYDGPEIQSNATTVPPIYPEAGTPRFINGEWVQPGVVAKVSPVQFKLLFTVSERVAIKTSEDPIVKDFFEIVNDPRLTFVDLALESTKQALAYLHSKNLIGEGRAAQILTGVIQ